jgi:hypothetical protein
MANFSDLVRTQRQSGAGVTKSLASAAGQQILEKVDIRNYLFSRKGTMTALFPGLKGYQAGGRQNSKQISGQSSSGGGLATEQITQLSDSIDKLGVQISIVAKNSYSLPMMSRDMNVMRQNIVKLVKISGGTAATKADMFFMKSKDREASYENQFNRSRNTSPTTVNAAPAEKEGFFSGLLKGGFAALLPLLVKAGLVAGLAAAIKAYVDNPEFRETINKGVRAVFETILEFMKEHWQETLIALALLFPRTTLAIIGEGLSLLASVLGATAKGGGLVSLFRGLIGVLSGPVGVIALLGLMAYGLAGWLEKNTDIGKKGLENLKYTDTPQGKKDMAPPLEQGKDPNTGFRLSRGTGEWRKDEMIDWQNKDFDANKSQAFAWEVDRRAQQNLWKKYGPNLRAKNADGTWNAQYLQNLAVYRKEAREGLLSEINAKRTEVKMPAVTFGGDAPKPEAAPASANSPVPVATDGEHQEEAPVSANSPSMIKLAKIQSKTGASAVVNADYAGKFQALIDYLDSIDYPIKSIHGYSDRNIKGTNTKSIHAYGAAIDINPEKNPMGKNLVTDLPPAAIQKAKELGLGWGGDWTGGKKDAMHFSADVSEGGKLVAIQNRSSSGPVLASNGNARPNGQVIASNSAAIKDGKNDTSNGNQTVNNVVNNQTVAQASAGIPASAYDTDLIRYLLRPVT